MRKPGKASIRAARSERLAAALRENLKRHKAQARGRVAAGAADDEPAKAAAERDAKTPDFRRNRSND
jgi:hypothetical protein